MNKLVMPSLIASCFAVSACTDAEGANDALRKAGYTNIRTGGYAYWSCGRDDSFATKFSADGPTGIPVTGAVCSGFLKGNTIRID